VEKKITPKTEIKTMVQPTDVKPIVQPKQEEQKPEDDGEEGGEEGGVKGGVAGGVKGGVVGGQVGGQIGGTGTGSGPAGQPKTVPQFVLSASKLNAPDPHLPDWFRNQHAGQTVRGTYRVCIRQDGRVSDVYSIAGIPGADQAVIETVKSQWMFKPQGLPVCAPWVFVFKIN
jgi:protein TonB